MITMLITEKDWQWTAWDPLACMVLPSVGGGFAVVCNTTQTTIAHSDTKQEAYDFIGSVDSLP